MNQFSLLAHRCILFTQNDSKTLEFSRTLGYVFMSISLLLFAFSLNAQSVDVNATSQNYGIAKNAVIAVETKDNAIVFKTDKTNRLFTVYFGKKLNNTTEYASVNEQSRLLDDNAGIYNHAYTPSGSFNLMEPAFQVTHADGNKSSDLLYGSHSVQKMDDNVSITSIVLKDPIYALSVTLNYKTSTLKTNQVFSGNYLMNVGFNPDMTESRTSVVLELNAQ